MSTSQKSRATRWLLVLVTAVLAAAGLGAVAAFALPGPASSHRASSHRASAHRPTPHATAGCRKAAPTTATGYAKGLNSLKQGGDATLSVRVRSGRVAWIFADTLIPGVGMPHSTVVMQDRGCFTATRKQLLPNDADGTFWWPAAATALPDGSVLIAATNGYGGVARGAITREVGGVLRFDHWLPSWPKKGSAAILWGAGLLVHGRTLIVYGTRSTHRYLVFGDELYAATVPLAGLAKGTGWKLGTEPIYGASPHGVDTTVAPYRDAKGYHLITLQDGVYGNGPLVSLDSKSPTGPFTSRYLLTYRRAGQVRYNAEVHPEARLTSGKVLVTINNNWPDGTLLKPISTYQPSCFESRR